ncbi:MAG: flagellar hook-basal body complex protein FliE [Acidobacteria bacterium]|nr:flagellar hook-basal body complex protein FliE [Acidobacteriota bacterium]
MAIDRISSSIASGIDSSSAPRTTAVDFGSALERVVAAVDGSAGEANQAIGRMVDGTGDVHEAMIALQRADTLLQLTVQIRNKLVQAYQDVMRMPV